MLPEIRHDEGICPVPQFSIQSVDIDEGFMDELRHFHVAFKDGFARSEPRENFFRYMVGQFSPLERKSIQPIALRQPARPGSCHAIHPVQRDKFPNNAGSEG